MLQTTQKPDKSINLVSQYFVINQLYRTFPLHILTFQLSPLTKKPFKNAQKITKSLYNEKNTKINTKLVTENTYFALRHL